MRLEPPDAFKVRRFLSLILILFLASLITPSCGETDGAGDSGPVGDEDDDDSWTPGDIDSGDCAYGSGYGEDCRLPTGRLDCSEDPCIFGKCKNGACECDEGYAGELCDECDEGYVVRGLACILIDACTDYPCVYGSCRILGEEPLCECYEGYGGDFCDRCAEGHHPENLLCVPD